MRKLFLIILLSSITNFSWADEYYLGQWEWIVDEGGYWNAPQSEFRTSGIDFRSIPQKSQAGGIPQGYAIFSYSQIVSDPSLIYLGNKLDSPLSNPILTILKARLGIANFQETTLRGILWEALTVNADPTGQTRWKPLMPGHDSKMRLYLGTQGKIKEIALIPFISPEWDIVLAKYHEDYRNLVETENYRTVAKSLDYLEQQYNVDYSYFIPDDAIVRIVSLPHNTTITDNFNCVNSDSLNCVLTWTELTGDYDISSNKAICNTSNFNCEARADSALSSSNQYAQATASDSYSTRARGVIINKDSSATRSFYVMNVRDASGLKSQIYSVSSGTYTQLASVVSSFANGETVKGENNGGALAVYMNGTLDTSVTDTTYTNLYAGLFAYNNVYLQDNFEAADLAVATTDYLYDATLYDSTLY